MPSLHEGEIAHVTDRIPLTVLLERHSHLHPLKYFAFILCTPIRDQAISGNRTKRTLTDIVVYDANNLFLIECTSYNVWQQFDATVLA